MAEPGLRISDCCGHRRPRFSQLGVRIAYAPVFAWGDVDGRASARTPEDGAALQARRSRSDFRILEHRSHPCGAGRTARARCRAPRTAIARGRASPSSRIGPCRALIMAPGLVLPHPHRADFSANMLIRRRHWPHRHASSLPVAFAVDGDVTALLYLPRTADLSPAGGISRRYRNSEHWIALDRFSLRSG